MTLEDVAFVQNIVSKGLGYPLAQSRLALPLILPMSLSLAWSSTNWDQCLLCHKTELEQCCCSGGIGPCSFLFVFATLVSLAWGWKYVMISLKGADQRHLVAVGRVLWHRLGVA